MRILVRLPNWLGDVVIATPALHVLRERMPHAHIAVLGLAGVVDALQNHPAIDRILVYDRKNRDRGVAGMWRLARRLRAEQFDRAYIFPNSFASALPAALAGIPERVGFRSDGRSPLLTYRMQRPAELAHRHQCAGYVYLVSGEVLSGVPEPGWFVSPDEKREVESLLRNMGLKRDRPFLAVNPGSVNGYAKRWPSERYARTIKWAALEAGWDVAMLGGPSDVEVAQKIAFLADIPLPILAGQTTIRQFMAVLMLADVVLSNDSGGMHVAAALNRPQLCLFGPTDPCATGPLGDRQIILRKPVGCAPCLDTVCREKSHFCMERISVEEVCRILAWMMAQIHSMN